MAIDRTGELASDTLTGTSLEMTSDPERLRGRYLLRGCRADAQSMRTIGRT